MTYRVCIPDQITPNLFRHFPPFVICDRNIFWRNFLKFHSVEAAYSLGMLIHLVYTLPPMHQPLIPFPASIGRLSRHEMATLIPPYYLSETLYHCCDHRQSDQKDEECCVDSALWDGRRLSFCVPEYISRILINSLITGTVNYVQPLCSWHPPF